MTPIPDLLTRLRAATEPDRELDAEIWETLGLTRANEDHCRHWCGMDGRTDLTRKRFIAAWAPLFTASLDAARTTVPKILLIDVGEHIKGADATTFIVCLWERPDYTLVARGLHASEQYATLIASFEARLAMEGADG